MKNSLKILTMLSVISISCDASGMHKFWRSVKSCCGCCDTVDLSENQSDDIELQLNDLGFRDDIPGDGRTVEENHSSSESSISISRQKEQSDILLNMQDEVFARLNDAINLEQKIRNMPGLQDVIERRRSELLTLVSPDFLNISLEDQCKNIINELNNVSVAIQQLLGQLQTSDEIINRQIQRVTIKMVSVRNLHTMCELLYLQGRIHIND